MLCSEQLFATAERTKYMHCLNKGFPLDCETVKQAYERVGEHVPPDVTCQSTRCVVISWVAMRGVV